MPLLRTEEKVSKPVIPSRSLSLTWGQRMSLICSAKSQCGPKAQLASALPFSLHVMVTDGAAESCDAATIADLVFIQNGMLQPWLDERGLGDNTQVRHVSSQPAIMF